MNKPKALFQTEFYQDNASYKTFPEKPPERFRQEFLKFVKETGRPEDFPGLYWGEIAPDEEYILLKKDFTIDRHKRPQKDRAFCPRCKHKNKYLTGSLAYFPRLQVVAAIGSECASQDVQDRAEKLYKQQELVANARRYLSNNVPHLEQRRQAISRSRKPAREALRIYQCIKSRSAEFHMFLRAAKRDGRKLSVVKEVKGESSQLGLRSRSSSGGWNSTSTIEEVVGYLNGETMALSDYNPIKKLDEIDRLLKELPPELEIHIETLSSYLSSIPDKDLTDSYVRLVKADEKFKKFEEQYQDFLSFFERSNINLLNKWGTHPHNPNRFDVEMYREDNLEILCIGSERYSIFPEMFALRPNWPLSR